MCILSIHIDHKPFLCLHSREFLHRTPLQQVRLFLCPTETENTCMKISRHELNYLFKFSALTTARLILTQV